MKSLLNKLKSLFAIVLIFPLMFIFSACGKKDKNNGNTNPPSGGLEQPEGETPGGSGGSGEGGSGDSGQDTPTPEVQNFSVAIDYNLPEYLADLKADETKTAVVSTGCTLPTFVGTEYEDYFTGWVYYDGETVENGVVYGTKDSTVQVKATWDELKLKQFFYTDGIEFTFSEVDGNYYASVSSYEEGTSEIVVLPQSIINGDHLYHVNGVGASAFAGNDIVKEVRTYLTDFIVSNSAFENSTLEKLEFEKVSYVGASAFKNTKVKTVTFSNYLESFSNSMFEGCTELETVRFASPATAVIGLKILPNYAFKGCSKLSTIDLSTSTTEIGVESFKGCSLISSFDFIKNSSVEKISNSAFANCAALENIEIPTKIVSYGTQIFAGSPIKQIKIPTAALKENVFEYYFGDLSETLEKIEFVGTTSAIIPESYMSEYKKLTDVVMCNSITAVKDNAFFGCSNLENITFSNAINGDNFSISAYSATKWILGLESYLETNSKDSLVINETLVYISTNVSGNYEIPADAKYLIKELFKWTAVNVTSVSIHKDVEYINKDAFAGSKITSITLANDNDNYTLTTHNLEVDELNTIGTGHSLCRLEGSNPVELIAYISTVSGGIIVIDENVTIVNDSAFDLKNAPELVYAVQKVSVVSNGGQNVDYVFESDESTTSKTHNRSNVYKILDASYYTIDGEFKPVITDIDVVSALGENHLIIVNVDLGEDMFEDVYYLVDINGETYTLEKISLPL